MFFISFCSSTCIFCSDHGGKCYSNHSQWYACGCSCYCIWCYSNYPCSSGAYVISIMTIYKLTKIVETAAVVLRLQWILYISVSSCIQQSKWMENNMVFLLLRMHNLFAPEAILICLVMNTLLNLGQLFLLYYWT